VINWIEVSEGEKIIALLPGGNFYGGQFGVQENQSIIIT
jgi:hypothetical protein